uniref:Uncharacterized protein n=1 Tax=Globisporangium ultimum (strain ATCC 200006 / CBS 805.95 / DAOM BR144) TaxID=431595 RepID=K3WIV4_GLOUD
MHSPLHTRACAHSPLTASCRRSSRAGTISTSSTTTGSPTRSRTTRLKCRSAPNLIQTTAKRRPEIHQHGITMEKSTGGRISASISGRRTAKESTSISSDGDSHKAPSLNAV